MGALAGAVLLAVAVAVAGVAGLGRPRAGLTAAGPAQLAGAQFTGPAGVAAQALPPSLTGVAAAGSTVVAVGSRSALPSASAFMLASADGGHTWQPAAVLPGGSGGVTGPDGVPVMVAGGAGHWLALAPGAVWTSTGGRSWQLRPGLAPLAEGDRVLGLTWTAGGFLAVGETVQPNGHSAVASPVLWTSADGVTWQRRDASQLDLPVGSGRVTSLRWAATHGDVILIGGEIAATAAGHQGGLPVTGPAAAGAVWRSTDGIHWTLADPPVTNGATSGVAGLAATGHGLVVIRPGDGPHRVSDAVAYMSSDGVSWRFAGVLNPHQGTGLTVTAIGGSDQGAVVAGRSGAYQVAFTSMRGWIWHQTADLGASPGGTVTAATVGPGDEVIAAGAAGRQPFLLLAGAQVSAVGQAALAGAATTSLSVNCLGTGPAGQVAAGSAAGAPAIWYRPAGGSWSAAVTPGSLRGAGPGLTSVADGGAGWLAAGGESGTGAAAPAGPLTEAVLPAGPRPVIMTSPDARTWHTAAGAGSMTRPGIAVTGVAAGPAGYVAAGDRDVNGVPVAAFWWSAKLASWAPQEWWSGTTPGHPSAVLAVAAAGTGFAAVGAIGAHPAVWLSPDGRRWRAGQLPVPAGAGRAVLQRVAAGGGRIVATGVADRPSGPRPFAEVSADGGGRWRRVALPAPPGQVAVTAMTAAGPGFVVAGTWRAAGTGGVTIWWSADGLSWHVARPGGQLLSGPRARISGLSAAGGAVTGIGGAVTPAGQQPVLWQAQFR